MNHVWLDIRFALRQLRKSPGFTLTAALTLAFGIGATTAIFSIVEGVLLRPLPFRDPGRLVVLSDVLAGTNFGGNGESGVTIPDILAYERYTRGFAGLGGFAQTGYELSGAGAPAQISATRVTASIFPTLGVGPLIGHAFTQQEDDGSVQVAVISYGMWRSRFAGDTHILGRKILLDRKPYQIIGVMPRSFEFPLVPGQLNRSQLWVPLSPTHDELTIGAASWCCGTVGRLKPGVTAAQAQQDAEQVAQQIMRGYPAFMTSLHISAVVHSLAEDTVAEARPLLRTLFLAVAVVLFIACANLAGLLLVRVLRRRREIAVRLALGSGGRAIVRQTLIETLALSIAGGLLGLGLADAALRVGVSFLPETLPRIDSIRLDWRVVGFALGAAVLTGLLCGLIPALAAARTGVNETLKEGGRTGTSRVHARLRSALVVTEIAVALVLLIASGLLLRSFEKLREVDLGFRTDHMLTADYGLPQKQYSTQASIDAFNDTLLGGLRHLPGVEEVGVTSSLPGSGDNGNWNSFVADGYVPSRGEGLSLSWASRVMGDYFTAAGIPLLRGRAFTDADNAKAPLVCVVNRALAQHFWPGQDPIGKRARWGMKETPTPWMTVVGEISDIKQTGPAEPTRYQIYQPYSQMNASFGSLVPPDSLDGQGGVMVLRTALAPDEMMDALRDTVRSIDPQLPLTHVQSMDQAVSETEAPRRFNAALISSFAAAAVLLALLGVYSVIAFSAAMRTQEMAIRLALGSPRSGVMGMILASGAKLGVIGCAIGAAGAVFATRLLRTLLFEVSPLDPWVMALAAVTIFALALAASLAPARRAAAIEPMEALRME